MSKNHLKTICYSVMLANAAMATPIASAEDATVLEEVLVTATKRETTLQDTAMSVSAFSGDNLAFLGYSSTRDFLESVPGVTAMDRGGNNTTFVIRNVGNSITREGGSTSTYIDEFPMLAGISDIKLVDMQSVEVLKGPQGTLWGKAAMGGVIRYITNKPSTEGIEGGVSASISDTTDAGETNYDFTGYLNLPINDQLAVRGTFYQYHEAGFIDIVPITGLGQFAFLPSGAQPGELLYEGTDNVNEYEYTGGRLALRYQPSDTTTIDLAWVNQRFTAGGYNATMQNTPWTSTDLEDFEAAYAYGFRQQVVDLNQFNLTLGKEFDSFDLTLALSQAELEEHTNTDDTLFFSALLGLGPSYDIPAIVSDRPFEADTKTAELRLVSDNDSSLNWIVGAYYEEGDQFGGLDGATDSGRAGEIFGFLLGTEPGFLILASFSESYFEETSVFGEIGYAFSDQFSVTFGARYSDVSQWSKTLSSEGSLRSDFLLGVQVGASETVDTYKFVAEYRPTEDIMIYGLASSGYRAGGKNPTALDGSGTAYGSDSLWNYEFGVKSTWLDGRLTANATYYFIDWTDMQLTVTTAGGTVETANVGEAEISGIEGEINYQINDELRLSLAFNFSEAEMAEDYDPSLNPATGIDASPGDEAFAGDRLPASVDESFSVTLDWRKPLNDSYDLFANLNHRYIGDKTITFNATNAVTFGHPDYFVLDDYSITNLTLGVGGELNNGNGYEVALFAHNLLDEVAETAYLEFYSDVTFINDPRTVGLRFSMDF